MSQHTTKPTIRLVRPAKTQISVCICTVWSESLQSACAFYSRQAIKRGINKNPCISKNTCRTGWMYRLIRIFAVTQKSYCRFCPVLIRMLWVLIGMALASTFCMYGLFEKKERKKKQRKNAIIQRHEIYSLRKSVFKVHTLCWEPIKILVQLRWCTKWWGIKDHCSMVTEFLFL